MSDIFDDLQARGLIQDSTDPGALRHRLATGPISLYYGCDPSAPSLHVGNLIGLLVLRRFADAGHHPVALVGGATGMVGDPGGRSEERNLLDEQTLAANVAGIRAQVDRIVGEVAEVVDNRTWTQDLSVLDFLRDVGKHVTVNQMLARESIRARVESEHGISYTEFSYMLLQANDYWHLNEHHAVELQIGGSDQWGNIVAGVDLVRRRSQRSVHALTWPLMTRADGAKFGKSAGGAVWLSAAHTSPYQFFQYWMNVDDRDVERFLLQLTLLDAAEAKDLARVHAEDPARRVGQHRLAEEVTAIVHGARAARAAAEASVLLFGGDPDTTSADGWELVAAEIPTIGVPDGSSIVAGLDPVPLMVGTGLAGSNSDARRLLRDQAVRVGARRLGPDDVVVASDLHHGRYALLTRGKKAHGLLDCGEATT